MSIELKIFSLIFLTVILFFINYLLIKDKISIKYAIIWLIPIFTMLLFVLIPNLLICITIFLGFQTSSNMIFAILISLLLYISLALTVIVSRQKNQIRLLIQEISIIKRIIKNNEK